MKLEPEIKRGLQDMEVSRIIDVERNRGISIASVSGIIALFVGYGAVYNHPNETVQTLEAIGTISSVVVSLFGLSRMHNANRARLQERIDRVRIV